MHHEETKESSPKEPVNTVEANESTVMTKCFMTTKSAKMSEYVLAISKSCIKVLSMKRSERQDKTETRKKRLSSNQKMKVKLSIKLQSLHMRQMPKEFRKFNTAAESVQHSL